MSVRLGTLDRSKFKGSGFFRGFCGVGGFGVLGLRRFFASVLEVYRFLCLGFGFFTFLWLSKGCTVCLR